MKKEYLSIIITIILIGSIVGLLSTNVIPFSDVSSAIAYVLVAGIIGVLIWGFKSKITSKIKTNEKEFRIHDKKGSIQSNDERKPKNIAHKTIKVHLEEYEEIKLNLKKNEVIKGQLSSDGFFNIYFLTESSFRSFKNNNNFQSLDGSKEVSHFVVNFDVPRRGTYFVVFENADKKNIVVNMELYRN